MGTAIVLLAALARRWTALGAWALPGRLPSFGILVLEFWFWNSGSLVLEFQFWNSAAVFGSLGAAGVRGPQYLL